MEIIIRILILFVTFQNFSQVSEKGKVSNDTININYDYINYEKVAYDSIKSIYENQKKLIEKNQSFKATAISMLYDFNQLKLVSIPQFKIKKMTVNEYTPKKNFEEFIDFKQDFSFQTIVVKHNDTIVNYVEIPDYGYELSRVNKGDVYFNYDRLDYENHVLKTFINAKEALEIRKMGAILESNPNSFFFTIFGLRDILFEVEKQTGELYCNWIGGGVNSDRKKRTPANIYIPNFTGSNIINEMSFGNYDSNVTPKTCSAKKKLRKKVILVVKK